MNPKRQSRQVVTKGRVFRSFLDARRFVRSFRFARQREYLNWTQGRSSRRFPKPSDIPVRPDRTYRKHGWTNWEDFLGTGRVPKHLRPWLAFEEARAYVRALKLKNQDEWNLWVKGKLPGRPPKPDNLPASAHEYYRGKGWNGYGDWLGTGNLSSHGRVYRSYGEAGKLARRLGIKSCREWADWSAGRIEGVPKIPGDVPRNPAIVYRSKGWTTWGDFLGTGRVSNLARKFLPFGKARDFVRNLGIKDQPAWRAYCRGELKSKGRRPAFIPASPNISYKNAGWTSFGDWLGNGNVSPRKRIYRPFEKARNFVHRLKLGNSGEWEDWCSGRLKKKPRKPDDIPRNPQKVYAGQWLNWPDWIGGTSSAAPWRPLEGARDFARKLKLKSRREWAAYCRGKLRRTIRKPGDIPVSAHKIYAGAGWLGWEDFLGTVVLRSKRPLWRRFESARAFARGLKLRSPVEWFAFCRGEMEHLGPLPGDVPRTPVTVYLGDGWNGWPDWLGNSASPAGGRRRAVANK